MTIYMCQNPVGTSMPETVESTFRVIEIRDRDILVKELDTGFVSFVEARSRIYDTKLWNQIQRIKPDDIVELELESQNQLNTIWHIKSVQQK